MTEDQKYSKRVREILGMSQAEYAVIADIRKLSQMHHNR